MLLLALSILATFDAEQRAIWGGNSQFETELYGTGNGSFCVLKTALGTTSNGIDYRFAIVFGAKNEFRLITEDPLPGLTRMTIRFPDGRRFPFVVNSRAKLAHGNATSSIITRGRSSALLVQLRGGGGTVTLDLPHGSPSFDLPNQDRAAAMTDAAECTRALTGYVEPD